MSIPKKISEINKKINKLEGKKEYIEEEIINIKKEINQNNELKANIKKAKEVIQETSRLARLQIKEKIENIVSEYLKFVFGNNYSFEIKLSISNKKSKAQFYIVSQTKKETIRTRVRNFRGGGVLDIVSLSLRLAFLQLHQKPKLNGPIILDEPFKFVSKKYLTRTIKLLKTFSLKFDRQFIIITHKPKLKEKADKLFKVEFESGTSLVKEIE